MKTTFFKMMSLGFMALAFGMNACKKDQQNTVVKPDITTDEVKGLTNQSTFLNAIINSTGGASITQCGFVWSSTQPNPTLEDKEGFTEEGPHEEQFGSAATGLNSNTSYYIRAYATNKKGTSYGEVKYVAFDYDGNLYHTVKIGNQIWILENLKTTHFSDHSPISYQANTWSTISSSAMCTYENSAINNDIYGALYNWYAVDDPNGLAPAGWRIPTKADWENLINTVNSGNSSGAGVVLKQASGATSLWEPFNGISNTNASGFTALPGGLRNGSDGSFSNITQDAYFWMADLAADGNIQYGRLQYTHDQFLMLNASTGKNSGLSVRCVKDAP